MADLRVVTNRFRSLSVLLLASIPIGCAGAPPIELVGVVHDDRALRGAHDVEVQGEIAYVAGKGGSLGLVDVSDAARPVVVGSIVDILDYADTETVLPAGDLLFVGARDLIVVDVRDPARPREVARVRDRSCVDRINGMVRRGDWLLAACKIGYVTAFDVSDPAAPELFGAFDTGAYGGPISPHDIALLDEERVVVVDAARQSPANLQVYRVFDETGALMPCEDWGVEGALPTDPRLRWDLGGANRVAVRDGLAFVGAYSASRFGIVDLGDPTRPEQLANIPCGDISANGLTVVGDVAFVCGGDCVEAIDVSDPTWPVSLACFRGGALFPDRSIRSGGERLFDSGHDLVYRDGHLFVTAQNGDRLGVLRVNDPAILDLVEGGRRAPPAR